MAQQNVSACWDKQRLLRRPARRRSPAVQSRHRASRASLRRRSLRAEYASYEGNSPPSMKLNYGIATLYNPPIVPDAIQRFLFEHAPVRGEIVHLEETWRTVLAHQAYPPCVRALLGEMMAAAALLTATLKFGGTLIMQIQGTGPLSLVVVECTSRHRMRATAKWSAVPESGTLAELVGSGRFGITLDPGAGRSSYQSIVAIEGETIAAALEQYMLRSEQIDTRLWLSADE